MSEKCLNCRFYRGGNGSKCHHDPPATAASSGGFFVGGFGLLFGSRDTGWPSVEADDWCGKFELKEQGHDAE